MSQNSAVKPLRVPRVSMRRRVRRSFGRHWALYLLMLVPLVHLAVFKYVPMVNAVIAFKDYNVVRGIWGSDWAGVRHFQAMFDNPVFWDLVTNTFLLSLYAVIAAFPIPIILALALNEIRQGFFKRAVQLVTYAPYFISTVVVVSVIILLLSPRLGLSSHVFGFFGVDQVDLLGGRGLLPAHLRLVGHTGPISCRRRSRQTLTGLPYR